MVTILHGYFGTIFELIVSTFFSFFVIYKKRHTFAVP